MLKIFRSLAAHYQRSQGAPAWAAQQLRYRSKREPPARARHSPAPGGNKSGSCTQTKLKRALTSMCRVSDSAGQDWRRVHWMVVELSAMQQATRHVLVSVQ